MTDAKSEIVVFRFCVVFVFVFLRFCCAPPFHNQHKHLSVMTTVPPSCSAPFSSSASLDAELQRATEKMTAASVVVTTLRERIFAAFPDDVAGKKKFLVRAQTESQQFDATITKLFNEVKVYATREAVGAWASVGR